jgi:regulator of replication initiation timing
MPTPNKSDNSKQRLVAIAAVIIVALLAVNAFLLISYNKRGKANTELSSQLDETEKLKQDLEKQYYEAVSELESMRGSNEELNTLIETQKEELKTQKDKIDGLLANKGSLDKARKEISNLKAQVQQYLAEVNQLREQNQILTEDNSKLKDENQGLATNLESERQTSAQLNSEKVVLVNEREQLSKKVSIASVVKVNGISVTPQKTRKSGKAVSRKNASNVDQINICFNATENQVVEEGQEIFYIRIINPLGETLAVDDQGSGVLTNSANGEQVRYTQTKEVQYNRQESNYCLLWAPSASQGFQKGTYEIEVYNKGYMAGRSTFTLK